MFADWKSSPVKNRYMFQRYEISSSISFILITDRFVRKYFYDMAADAALNAAVLCSDKKISNRMKMTVMFPEMNPQMDSYR
jgi:hypothetical protein